MRIPAAYRAPIADVRGDRATNPPLHRTGITRVLRWAALTVPLFGLLTGCGYGLESFNVVTPQGGSIATLFYLSFILSGLILALVVGVLIAVLVRFRARPGQAEPRQVTGNRRLEIGWTAGALALVTLLFVLSVLVMNRVQAAQDDPLRVQVIGRQWWWEYRYPSLNIVTANELHLPVDRPV